MGPSCRCHADPSNLMAPSLTFNGTRVMQGASYRRKTSFSETFVFFLYKGKGVQKLLEILKSSNLWTLYSNVLKLVL